MAKTILGETPLLSYVPYFKVVIIVFRALRAGKVRALELLMGAYVSNQQDISGLLHEAARACLLVQKKLKEGATNLCIFYM